MRVLFVALLALVTLAQPAQAHFEDFSIPDFHAIIGGTEVSALDPIASTTVLIVGQEGLNQFLCSGSIIDTDIILTAAHCLGMFGNAKTVVVFRRSIQDRGAVIPVIDSRRPWDFPERADQSPADWNDIALLKLAAPIPTGYTTAKFLPNRNMLSTGGTVTLAGYGMSVPIAPADNTPSGSGILRRVEQTVLAANFGFTEFLVSLANGRGACHGDSGGPAFVQSGRDYYLIGVASRMTENDRVADNGDANDFSCSVDMVYGNVLAQQDWIQQNIDALHKGM